MKWMTRCVIFLILNSIVIPVFALTEINKCLTDFKSHIINKNTIWFDDCGLSNNDVPKIVSYLNKHHEITQLYLLNNHIGDEGAILLAKSKTLKMLELRNNDIGKKGVTALASSSIHMLDLQGNKYKSVGLIAIAQNNTSIILG
jgi:Ran GTPase-activating protein (RanGAP) involved in mRNA processing and transport